MREPAVHYCGALAVKRRHTTLYCEAGWAVCCSGRAAYAVRERGNQTFDRAEVTCRRCLRLIVALCPECNGRGQLALRTTTISITAKCAACNGTGRA